MTDYLQPRRRLSDPCVASAFDDVSVWGSRFGALIFAHLELRPNLDVLDVACGTGFPLIELAQMHGRSSRFTGVDTWSASLQRARFKLQTWDRPDVHLVQSDAGRLPFPDQSFDLIVSNLGINNVADPHAVLGDLARVARPGARLVMTTNLVGHMREFYDVYRQLLTEIGEPDDLARLAVNEAHRGTPERFSAWLTDAGFHVTRTIHDQFPMRFVDGSALLRHALTRYGFLDGWRSAVTPDREQAIFTELEARLNALAAREGELRLTIPMLYLEAQR